MKRLPKWLEAVERLAGMGIEHPIEEVEADFARGRLTIVLPDGRRFRFKRSQIPPADAKLFLKRFNELRARPSTVGKPSER